MSPDKILLHVYIHRIQAMEREKCTHLYSRRSDFRQDFSQLEDQDNKSTGERKAERKFFIQNMDDRFRSYMNHDM